MSFNPKTTKALHVRIEVHERLQELAFTRGLTLSETVKQLINSSEEVLYGEIEEVEDAKTV